MHNPAVFHPTRSKYLVITIDYLVPLLIILMLSILAYFALFSSYFSVQEIICLQDQKDCQNPSLSAELESLRGQNIFRLSTTQLTTKLTSGDFTIRSAQIGRTLPGTVTVSLLSVYPVVAIQVEGDPTWVVLDRSYRVIGTRQSPPNVPSVTVRHPLTIIVGQPLQDPQILGALELALILADELFALNSLTLIDQDTIELVLQNGKIALFTPQKNELEQLRLLQSVLADATITQEWSVIDVRWANPVLR